MRSLQPMARRMLTVWALIMYCSHFLQTSERSFWCGAQAVYSQSAQRPSWTELAPTFTKSDVRALVNLTSSRSVRLCLFLWFSFFLSLFSLFCSPFFSFFSFLFFFFFLFLFFSSFFRVLLFFFFFSLSFVFFFLSLLFLSFCWNFYQWSSRAHSNKKSSGSARAENAAKSNLIT